MRKNRDRQPFLSEILRQAQDDGTAKKVSVPIFSHEERQEKSVTLGNGLAILPPQQGDGSMPEAVEKVSGTHTLLSLVPKLFWPCTLNQVVLSLCFFVLTLALSFALGVLSWYFVNADALRYQ